MNLINTWTLHIKNSLILGGLLLGLQLSTTAQTSLNWDMLGALNFTSVMDSVLGYAYMKPLFPTNLKALDGQEVQIKGYILPMDTEGEEYALSAFPYSSCFFCGGAGRESVIELDLAKKGQQFALDDIVTLSGIFRLGDDQFGLLYFMDAAKLLE